MKLQKMIQILETLEKNYYDAQIASQHLEVCTYRKYHQSIN